MPTNQELNEARDALVEAMEAAYLAINAIPAIDDAPPIGSDPCAVQRGAASAASALDDAAQSALMAANAVASAASALSQLTAAAKIAAQQNLANCEAQNP